MPQSVCTVFIRGLLVTIVRLRLIEPLFSLKLPRAALEPSAQQRAAALHVAAGVPGHKPESHLANVAEAVYVRGEPKQLRGEEFQPVVLEVPASTASVSVGV